MHRMLLLALDIERMPENDSLRIARLLVGAMDLLHARIAIWARFQLEEGTASSCRVHASDFPAAILADIPDRTRLARRMIKPLACLSEPVIADVLPECPRVLCADIPIAPFYHRLAIGSGLCSIRRHSMGQYSLLQLHRPATDEAWTLDDHSILNLVHSVSTQPPK